MFTDEHLKWKYHVRYISTEISKSIGIIYNARKCFDVGILKQLYFILTFFYLSYGAVVWGNTYSSIKKLLHILEIRVLRAIMFSYFRATSKFLFDKLHMLSIFHINQQQLGVLVYRHQNIYLTEVFLHYLTPGFTVLNYNTRFAGNQNLYLPKCHLNYGKFCVRFRASKAWNSLLLEIK